MSPVTCSSLVPAYSVGSGGAGPRPRSAGLFLAGGVLLGHVRGDGLGDGAVDEGDPEGGQPGGEDPVDVGGGLHRQGVGASGRPGGPARSGPPTSGRGARCAGAGAPGRGRRRSASSPCSWGRPRARPRGSGANAATAGVPSPPRDSAASRSTVAAPDGGAGVGGGGVQDAPLVGELELVEVGCAAAYFVVAQGASSASGPRSSTPDRSLAVLLMGLAKQEPPTPGEAQNPLSTRRSGQFRRTATTAVDPDPREPHGSDECQPTEAARHHVTENQDLRRRRRSVRFAGGGLDTVAAQPARPTRERGRRGPRVRGRGLAWCRP